MQLLMQLNTQHGLTSHTHICHPQTNKAFPMAWAVQFHTPATPAFFAVQQDSTQPAGCLSNTNQMTPTPHHHTTTHKHLIPHSH
jgi:hypothetical protein